MKQLLVIVLMQGLGVCYLKKQSVHLTRIIFGSVVQLLMLFLLKTGLLFPGHSLAIGEVVLMNLLLCAAIVDFERGIIPNEIIVIGGIANIMLSIHAYLSERFFWSNLKEFGVSVLCNLLLISFIFFISRNAIGYGDLKLLLICSFYSSFLSFFQALFLSFILAAFFAFFLFVQKKDKSLEFPFAPFLYLGYMTNIVIGTV